MNQKTNLDIALIEASNSGKALNVQKKELDIRHQQLEYHSLQKQETSKFFSKVLDKFIEKKESSQDIFICLKMQLEAQRDILGEPLFKLRLEKITADFINSDSV